MDSLDGQILWELLEARWCTERADAVFFWDKNGKTTARRDETNLRKQYLAWLMAGTQREHNQNTNRTQTISPIDLCMYPSIYLCIYGSLRSAVVLKYATWFLRRGFMAQCRGRLVMRVTGSGTPSQWYNFIGGGTVMEAMYDA